MDRGRPYPLPRPEEGDVELEQIQKLEPLTGAARFMHRIVYAKPTQIDACVLYFATTHIVENLNTIGRLLVTSTLPNSGKTTVMDAGVMMSHNAWMSDPTKWALQGKFKGTEKHTLFMDEIHLTFGLNGQRGRSNPIYKPVVEGYRRTATFSGQVDGAPQDFSAYCATVLGGLQAAVPPDVRTRCVNIVMSPAPETVELEDTLDEGVEADGRRIGEQMHQWTQLFADQAKAWAREARKVHPKLFGRKLQVWGGMYAVAKAAGPEWEKRFKAAFMELALSKSERPVLSPEQQVLWDAGQYLTNPNTPESPYLASTELLNYLRTLDDNVYSSKTDPQVARLMSAGLGRAPVLTLPSRKTVRGWHREVILAAYEELVALVEPENDDEQPDEFEDFFDEVYEGEFADDEEDTTETTETTETTVPSRAIARTAA